MLTVLLMVAKRYVLPGHVPPHGCKARVVFGTATATVAHKRTSWFSARFSHVQVPLRAGYDKAMWIGHGTTWI